MTASCRNLTPVVFAVLMCLCATALAGEVTVQPPTVNGAQPDSFGVWYSIRLADSPDPWEVPEPLEGPLKIFEGMDYRIIVKAAVEATPPTAADDLGPVERAIYELQRAAGLREE